MISDFKDKKVLIMGLGLHGGGVSVAKFFLKQKAKVLITDLKTKSQLKESLVKLAEDGPPRIELVATSPARCARPASISSHALANQYITRSTLPGTAAHAVRSAAV